MRSDAYEADASRRPDLIAALADSRLGAEPAGPVAEDLADDVPVTRSALRRLRPLLHLVTAVVFLAIWQLVSKETHSQIWVSSPSLIGHQLASWIKSDYLPSNALVTLKETVLGFIFGAAAGIITGVGFGLVPTVAWVADPFISAFYCIPQVALAPLFVLWFGIGLNMKVILAAVIVYFLVHTNTYAGVRNRDRELIDVVRVMGASRMQVVYRLVLPGARINIFTGLKRGRRAEERRAGDENPGMRDDAGLAGRAALAS